MTYCVKEKVVTGNASQKFHTKLIKIKTYFGIPASNPFLISHHNKPQSFFHALPKKYIMHYT